MDGRFAARLHDLTCSGVSEPARGELRGLVVGPSLQAPQVVGLLYKAVLLLPWPSHAFVIFLISLYNMQKLPRFSELPLNKGDPHHSAWGL